MIGGVVVSWRSQIQKTVTLSVIEAKYIAVAEVCTEILYVCTVLEFMAYMFPNIS